MSSLLTNNAAMTALQTLTATNKALDQTQSRISTGMRVATATDNAAYWSIATTMRSDNSALSTVKDALGLGAAMIDVAYTATESAIKYVDEIKTKLVAARQPGVDRAKVQSEIDQLQDQLIGLADSASFSGENWLSVDSSASGYSATKTIVSSFTRAADGSVSVGTISIDVTSTKLFDASASATGILDANGTAFATASVTTLDISGATITDANIESMISDVDDAIALMTTSASDLGAAKKRVGLQQDFVAGLMNAIERGVGQLVDADMNEESTRLSALQVQQQLGIQALSIANSNSQNILSLFR
jgi:flagellin